MPSTANPAQRWCQFMAKFDLSSRELDGRDQGCRGRLRPADVSATRRRHSVDPDLARGGPVDPHGASARNGQP